MEKAKKLTGAEIAALPWGAVVWHESHTILDCGKSGQVDGYRIYPMLVSVPGEFGMLSYIDFESTAEFTISDLPETSAFWDAAPEEGQIENGMPIDDALKIFNKYEHDELGLG